MARHMRRPTPGFPSAPGHSVATKVNVQQRAVIGNIPRSILSLGQSNHNGVTRFPCVPDYAEPDKSSKARGSFPAILNSLLRKASNQGYP